ncbi:MAG: Holliday junction branch migration protein RuvA [Bacteroidia bacterium]
MIVFLEGPIIELEPTYTVINCGGVGYRVFISLNTYEKIKGKKDVRLKTYHHIREDAEQLYGFAEGQEQRVFELLLSISGVGASTALTILSSMDANELATAISSEDVASLKKVKGIGAKTAARIILELKDKMGGVSGTSSTGGTSKGKLREDAVAGLLSLGFAKSEAEKRVDRILKGNTAISSSADLIRIALRN